MSDQAIRAAIEDARECALSMTVNAAYIEAELDGLGLPAALDARAREVCAELAGVRGDVVAELRALNERREQGPVPLSAARAHFERIVEWMQAPLEPMHELVRAIEAQAPGSVAWTLIVEAATNIYDCFTRARDSAALLWGDE